MTLHTTPDSFLGVRNAPEATSSDRRSADTSRGPLSKAVFDRLFAACALVALAPVFLAVTVALLVTDGRPVFFGHARIGRDGRSFRCWKFRTMVVDADARLEAYLAANPAMREEWELRRKLTNDPRVNRLGVFLRKTSLDELPQFWNVLRGDMALVGPRPVPEPELAYYGLYLADYTSVRPGLTGAWQVSGRSETTYAERVALDVRYVRNFTFWGDLKIVLRTVHCVVAMVGAR